MKKTIWVILLFFTLPCCFARAEPVIKSLDPWQGEFISRKCIIDRPGLATLYEKTAREADKLGKSCTGEDVKQALKKLFHTDFDRILIQKDFICFYSGSKGKQPVVSVRHRYRFEGRV